MQIFFRDKGLAGSISVAQIPSVNVPPKKKEIITQRIEKEVGPSESRTNIRPGSQQHPVIHGGQSGPTRERTINKILDCDIYTFTKTRKEIKIISPQKIYQIGMNQSLSWIQTSEPQQAINWYMSLSNRCRAILILYARRSSAAICVYWVEQAFITKTKNASFIYQFSVFIYSAKNTKPSGDYIPLREIYLYGKKKN